MKKTKLLTSLAALGLVISLGACDTTTQECEECPTCPEVTEPETGDEEDEAWATTPGELIDLASETMNYSVQLEFDTWESVEPMAYSSYNRLFVLDDALYYYYDPDEYDSTSQTYTSLWDDVNNTWVTRESGEGVAWTDGETRWNELYAEFLELYDEYENLFYDVEVTSSYVVDIFVDEDYMLAVTYEWQDVADYEENAEAEADWEYVFDSLDMYISDGEGGCIEITYGLVNVGNWFAPSYEYQWNAYSGSYPWVYYEYSLFFTGAYNFDGFFDYYGSGTLSGIPCTAWTISDDASFWGLEYDLAALLGAYTNFHSNYYGSGSTYAAYYMSDYYHYLTYFMEDYQEMLMDYYWDAMMTYNSRAYIGYYEEDMWIDLYDVGETDATTEINAVIAAYNASLVDDGDDE